MNTDILLCIFGMCLATLVPRGVPVTLLAGRELPPFEQQHDSRTETESVLLHNPHIPFQMTGLYLFYHNCLVTASPMLYKCRLFLS